jgi:hypothetical protein
MKRYLLSWPFARHIGSWATAVYGSKKPLRESHLMTDDVAVS